jgi:hypothetical protein
MTNILPKGAKAPNFTLHVTPDQTLSLHEFAGRRVSLLPSRSESGMRRSDEPLQPHPARAPPEWCGIAWGISVDGAWCHQAFARERRLHFALLSDFDPEGAVARSYGAHRDRDGVCGRPLFVTRSESFPGAILSARGEPGHRRHLRCTRRHATTGERRWRCSESRSRHLICNRCEPATAIVVPARHEVLFTWLPGLGLAIVSSGCPELSDGGDGAGNFSVCVEARQRGERT